MKVLLLTTHLDFGGISAYTVSLAKTLTHRGHKVTVCSSGGALVDTLGKEAIEHIQLDIRTKSELNPRVFKAVTKLANLIKQDKPDIIHAQTRVTQVMAHLLSKRIKVPFVSTCHGFFRPHIGRKALGFWGKKAIAISEPVREHLVNDLKVKKSTVSVIYNGVDVEQFSRKLNKDELISYKRRLNLKDGPIVGNIARLSPVKGQKFLVTAMKKVLQQIPDAQLLIVGSGPCQAELVNLVLELGIGHAVYMEDSTYDTLTPLSVMDLFVLPSLQEGLGLAVMEAMVAAKPVIGSNVGGVYSLIKDGKTGLLVAPEDAEALSVAIIKLLKDKDLAGNLATAANSLIKSEFSLDKMAAKVEGVYEEAIT